VQVSTWRIQSLRFIIIGLASNLILYLLYLALTAFGIGHKTAMTLLYLVGTLQTFIFNKRWTFSHHGNIQQSLLRYLAAYGACYILNLALLYTFVDSLGWSHALVQGLAILIVAALLFLVQKYWVFRCDSSRPIQAGEIA
jgi:putative flippase GtrA